MQFISIHRSPGLSKEDFALNATDILDDGYAQLVVSYVNFIDGTIINVFDADSEDSLIREYERLGWPYDEIHEVHLVATPQEIEKMVTA